MQTKVKVEGMHCSACEKLITEELVDNGAKDAKADHKSGDLTVEHDGSMDESKIREIVEEEGYKVK